MEGLRLHSPVLRYLDEVARQGSIRKAARVLNVASSAVNRQILKLEHELSARIFNRTAEGVELTPAGEVILEHARRTLYDYGRSREVVADIRELRTGHLHIATLDSPTFSLLPQLLESYCTEYPGISVSVETAGPEDVANEVAAGDVDIGITFTRYIHPSVRVVAETHTPFGAIVPPNHPLAARRFVAISDCAVYPIVRTLDTKGKPSLLDQEVSAEVTQLSAVFYSNSMVMSKAAITSGIGIGLYTKVGFINEIKNDELKFIAITNSPLSDLRLGVMISSQKNLEMPANLFVRRIANYFASKSFS